MYKHLLVEFYRVLSYVVNRELPDLCQTNPLEAILIVRHTIPVILVVAVIITVFIVIHVGFHVTRGSVHFIVHRKVDVD